MADETENLTGDVEALVSTYLDRGYYGGERERSLAELAQLGELAVESLAKKLRSANYPSQRAAAAEALGFIGKPSAANALIEALENDQGSNLLGLKLDYWDRNRRFQVRLAAMNALVQLCDASVVKTLIDALQGDTHSQVRRAAAIHLGKLGDQAAVKPLTEAILSDRAILVRQAAVHSLMELVDFAAFEPLAKALWSDKHPTVRLEAARALVQLGHPGGVKALAKALQNDMDYKVRFYLATALAELGDRAAVDAFVTALVLDESTEIRRIAVRALGKLGGITIEPFVEALQNDEDATVCAEAARALGRLADPATIEPLTKAVQRYVLAVARLPLTSSSRSRCSDGLLAYYGKRIVPGFWMAARAAWRR